MNEDRCASYGAQMFPFDGPESVAHLVSGQQAGKIETLHTLGDVRITVD